MYFAGIDDGHAARLGDMARALILIRFRASLDHGNRVRVVPVRRELVIVIFGREQIRARQKRRAPVTGVIAEAGRSHERSPGGPFSLARPVRLVVPGIARRRVQRTGIVVPAGIGTAVTLFFALPVATRSL